MSDVKHTVAVGDLYRMERRFHRTVLHTWDESVLRVTPTRAYFSRGHYMRLDDPMRELRPKYLDYTTVAVPLPAATAKVTP